ncbi:MAG: DNA polymerase III subunit gamma/tau, partial [Deltaproteobacteria bacterium]|nr:DNA polymerase III subunit gamma/tau [Deltaproteobacteria bacterium]
MSYVVLARKYRPMRFADMVGQEHIGRTLGNAIRQDRVHHAYLFSGARGLGKTTTARIFAKGLVCEQGPTPEPCNVCNECVAVSEGRSVDVMEIDGASNNSVDNIRNLREQVHYLPQTARRKVYIIDEVHMLTTSAFNALLKTLEEPPPHVNFVFATTEPQKVLPTILSRVNRLDFKRVSPTQLVGHLASILEREVLSVEPGGLRIIARAGGGSVRDALTLLDQVIAFAEDAKAVGEDEVRRLLGQADHSAVQQLVGGILDGDPTVTMQRFEGLVTAGTDLSVLSLQVLEYLRDLTVVKVCRSPDVLPDATETELEQLRTQAAKVDASHLSQLFDRFSRVIDRLPQSRSQRLLVEMGLLDLACAEPMIPLGDLVQQLHALGGGGPPAGGSPGRGGAPRAGGRGRASGGTRQRSASASPARPDFRAGAVGQAAPVSSSAPPRASAESFAPSPSSGPRASSQPSFAPSHSSDAASSSQPSASAAGVPPGQSSAPAQSSGPGAPAQSQGTSAPAQSLAAGVGPSFAEPPPSAPAAPAAAQPTMTPPQPQHAAAPSAFAPPSFAAAQSAPPAAAESSFVPPRPQHSAPAPSASAEPSFAAPQPQSAPAPRASAEPSFVPSEIPPFVDDPAASSSAPSSAPSFAPAEIPPFVDGPSASSSAPSFAPAEIPPFVDGP